MPTIIVKTAGGVAKRIPGERAAIEIEIAAGSRVADVLAQLSLTPADVPLILVNLRAARPDAVLEEGDVLSLLPFIVGG